MNIASSDKLDSSVLIEVVVQNAVERDMSALVPSDAMLSNCAQHSLAVYLDRQMTGKAGHDCKELAIRIVGVEEMQTLNRTYRHKDKPTNVLSFQIENQFEPLLEDGEDQFRDVDLGVLGDVVICHPVIIEEAQAQGKTIDQHYQHMVAHGVLHLCGLDHQDDEEASIMEAMEIEILAMLGVKNPYRT